MEPFDSIRIIPGPGRISSRLPSATEEMDKDTDRQHGRHRRDDPGSATEDRNEEHHPHHGRVPGLGEHLDLDA